MALKIDNQIETKLDWLKWLVIAVLTIMSLIANTYYSQQPWPLRFLAGLVIAAIVLGIMSQTKQGINAISFARESRMELRKVVWPTRQETMQTTLIIAAMVVVLALALWGIDGVLVSLIGWLTGQRG
jgi:preprotein translocase subunit SecE